MRLERMQHLTPIRSTRTGVIAAVCPEHGLVGLEQPDSFHGRNAVITEARAHDDIVHKVYRTDLQYKSEEGHGTREG